jgi:hypothetical protein
MVKNVQNGVFLRFFYIKGRSPTNSGFLPFVPFFVAKSIDRQSCLVFSAKNKKKRKKP